MTSPSIKDRMVLPLFALGLSLLILLPWLMVAVFLGKFKMLLLLLFASFVLPAAFFVIDLFAHTSVARNSRSGKLFYTVSTLPFSSKLNRLDNEVRGEGAVLLQTKGLMVRDIMQKPAVIQLREDGLHFHPVIGEPEFVSFDSIESVEESPWFNGSWNPGQTGFMLKVPGTWRVGFAIHGDPEPWREALNLR